MKKKIYCDICDKYISKKSSHNKTNTHKLLPLSVLNRFYIKIIHVETTDYVINEHIIHYNKKIVNFCSYVEIRNEFFCSKLDLGWLNLLFVVSSDEIKKRYKCIKKELVDLKFIFITGLEYQSYNHYLQQPRPMIGRQICRVIDRNPNLTKTLDKMRTAYS